jgi:hypothetical protein
MLIDRIAETGVIPAGPDVGSADSAGTWLPS